MASSSSASQSSQKQNQHRCVFVGNIPYDTTEEQLIQICEEVGPVVSFRLVIDRETGKPKGYGFCEYKDEETALSARRNLQGYEINGRQLRVDFAENDKNADRNKEQGRGGPGMVTNVDPQRQFGGPAVLGDSSIDQPMGVSVAINAAAAMARALGAAQSGNLSTQFGLQSQQALGSDQLTLHLAKMSRRQIYEIMSELKAMATQDKEQACQLLLAVPNLPKAIFQLLMPSIRQVTAPPIQPRSADAQQGQEQAAQTVPGLPPLPRNMMQFNYLPQAKETQVFTGHPSSSVQSRHTPLLQFPAHNQTQLPQLAQSQGLQYGQLPLQSAVPTLPSIRPEPLGNLSVGSLIQAAPSPSLKPQVQAPLPQHKGQTIVSGYNPQMPTSSTRQSLSDHGFQPSLSALSGMPDLLNKDSQRPQVPSVSAWAAKPGLLETGKLVNDSSDRINRPSKLVRLNDGRSAASLVDANMATSVAVPPPINSITGDQVPNREAPSNSEKQVSQVHLPPEMESALLQQVLNLTPEQLSSLPPDQQQQVIQLQQLLRQST